MATTSTGHMNILDDCPGKGYKLCRKKLHWFQGERCRLCRNARANATYHKKAKQGVAWYQQNKEAHNKAGKEQYWKNAEQRKEAWNRWRKNNLNYDLERNRKYSKENKDVVRRKAARRRANKKTQTPSWANLEQINHIYKKCPKGCHVDHIYPLKSDYMCGLHVETNLQILTEQENIAKGNKSWPGQLECQKSPVYAIFPKELTDLLNG
jgi:hypothetical protein